MKGRNENGYAWYFVEDGKGGRSGTDRYEESAQVVCGWETIFHRNGKYAA